MDAMKYNTDSNGEFTDSKDRETDFNWNILHRKTRRKLEQIIREAREQAPCSSEELDALCAGYSKKESGR